MAIPESYTEQELAEYMVAVLSKTADQLAITAEQLLQAEVINQVLVILGLSSIEESDDVLALRIVAEYKAWDYASSIAAMPLGINDQMPISARKVMKESIDEQQKLALARSMHYGVLPYAISVTRAAPEETVDEFGRPSN